jgi:hypothetical protein
MLEQHQSWENEEQIELRPLLTHARNCKSSDPRDRIYAFLGLANPEYNIIPSYKPSKRH